MTEREYYSKASWQWRTCARKMTGKYLPFLPSHQARQRPFQERQWKWSTLSASSSSSSEWTGLHSWWTSRKWEDYQWFFLWGVSVAGNGDSVVSDGVCEQYTAPRTSHTPKLLARRSRRTRRIFLCVVSKTVILTSASWFAPCFILHFLACTPHSDLFLPALSLEQDECFFHSARALEWAHSWTVSAHRLWAQRSCWSEQYRGYDALTLKESK